MSEDQKEYGKKKKRGDQERVWKSREKLERMKKDK